MQFEESFRRIMPTPKEQEILSKRAVFDAANATFAIDAPDFGDVTADYAAKRLKEKLTKIFGRKALAASGTPIVLSLGKTARRIQNKEEAYELSFDGKKFSVTGFGAKGLLHGVVTLTQLLRKDAKLPKFRVFDWPDLRFRGLLVESRYGSNVMEKQDWFDLIDDACEKKYNCVQATVYCCWSVQYDGEVCEYLYYPFHKHPELKTPMHVKYWSPEQGKWIDTTKLPPIYEQDFFAELVRYAKARGVRMIPHVSSFGHNTFMPRMFPETSAKNADGTPTYTGYCTSNPKTYELIFSYMDDLIDNALKPNGQDFLSVGLDEVNAGTGKVPFSSGLDPFEIRTPWCECPKCKKKSHGKIFVDHAIKIMSHLKEKGVKHATMSADMVLGSEKNGIPPLGPALSKAAKKAGVDDVLILNWWNYADRRSSMTFQTLQPELGLRAVASPFNGYFNWWLIHNPMRNICYMGEIANRDKGEGILAYATWDRSYDRMHEAIAENAWNYAAAKDGPDALTTRYAERHFPGMAFDVRKAYKCMDFCTMQRVTRTENEDTATVSHYKMLNMLDIYTYSYLKKGKSYPRNYPGEALEYLLNGGVAFERSLYAIAGMASSAEEIFLKAAKAEGCDHEMAKRMAYECHNYLTQAEDAITLLRMYQLQKEKRWDEIAALAEERYAAWMEMLTRCEKTKEKYICEALTMRNQSIRMQLYRDMADYLKKTKNPKFDLMDVSNFASKRFYSLR